MARKTETEGEFQGWTYWDDDPFENETGPFYTRETPDGRECAFRVETRHLNGHGHVHGGCLLAFADFALFGLASDQMGEAGGVTVSLSSEFVGPASEGDVIRAEGGVIGGGRSLIFVRGLMRVEDRVVFGFSGTIKKLRAG